jgi:response regulator RpfG family c-di-GMP phosphodiesterase
MPDDPRPRILCVDDEPNVLDGLKRTLRSVFIVETAIGGRLGLEILKTKGPFVVLTSDLRMPLMNGVEFLTRAREIAPETVRVLLTGQGDMEAAVSAVNDGNIFRFLTKPCATGVLVRSLMACAEQHRLQTAEKVLLEHTLRGCIKALTDILAMTNPAAFGRATRVERAVGEMMSHFGIAERWPVEVAAMLSQIGTMALPPRTQEKIYKGEQLTDEETEMAERVPAVAEELLANIPRLELVREILRLYPSAFAGGRASPETGEEDAFPWGARALKIALDYDIVESETETGRHPIDVLRARCGWYDPEILEGFAELRGRGKKEVLVHELMLREIAAGMQFGEDVKSAKGLLLIARGQEVTPSLLERVRNFSSELGIREPIRMIEPLRDSTPVPLVPT